MIPIGTVLKTKSYSSVGTVIGYQYSWILILNREGVYKGNRDDLYNAIKLGEVYVLHPA